MKNFTWIFSLLLIIMVIILIDNKGVIDKTTILKETFDAPGRAGVRDFEMMKDPGLDRIPFERYPESFVKTELLKTQNRNMQNLAWMQIPSDMGGRTKTICIDPNDATHKKIWAGSATGGLWVNQDISDPNSVWQPVGDVWETLSISSIIFDPNNPQVMYVGTGEYETAITDMYRESSGRGYGIWKSTDGGQSFSRLLSTQDFAYISDLAIKNDNGQSVLYAGVVSGTYRGQTFNAQPSEGLFRSFDGGQTWQQVLPDISGANISIAVSDIEITATGKILVGTKRNIDDLGGGNILVSDTGNSGSWTVINQFAQQINQDADYNIPGRVKLASAPSNGNIIYAVFAAKSLQQTIEGFPQTIGKFFAVSQDGGQTWQQKNAPVTSGNNWAYLAWHALSITVDPNNPQHVFAGGLDMYESNNGLNSWQQISDWTGMYYGGADDYVHADIHRIIYTGQTSGTLAIATDGGVFYSNNANTQNITFSTRNKSYNTLQCYATSISQNGMEIIAAGLQDNGTVGYYGNPITEDDMIQGGDGAFCQFDKNDNILITSTYDNQFKIYNYATGQINYIYDYASGLFTSTFDYDSTNNVIWAIASDLHNNRLGQVLKLTDLLEAYTGDFINLNTGADKYFSAIRLLNNDALLIGTANGHLYKVTHINSNPVSVELGSGIFPAGFISSIQIADNGQKILLTISNYGVDSVWLSNDGGQTWQNKEGNLPDIPVRWAIFHPQNPEQVMLATETGVWTTDHINADPVVWTPQSNGFPNVRVDMLDVKADNNKVVAGTHGRTMFTTIWDQVSGISDIKTIDFKLYPNPATDFIEVELPYATALQIFDLNGKLVLSKDLRKGTNHLSINNLNSGIYMVKVENTVKKLIVE